VGFCSVATDLKDFGEHGTDVFQSRCGFLLRRDVVIDPAGDMQRVFQSRCGFLLRRDEPQAGVPMMLNRFNPGVGFCSVATLSFMRRSPRRGPVSIPVWVSAPSRQGGDRVDAPRRRVSIPVWVSAPSRRTIAVVAIAEAMFQSRCGFLLRRDTANSLPSSYCPAFQSRCGFLLRRDRSQSVSIVLP